MQRTHLAAKDGREAELDELAQRLYQQGGRTFTPLYPWVFVRVLPKRQQIGAVWTPDHEQNKTIHEGIVLRTWRPHRRGGREIASLLVAGEHVLFPHWCGLPVPGYSDVEYRVVKDGDWTLDTDGGIFAVVEAGPDTVREELKLMLLQGQDLFASELADHILRKFLVMARDASSVTLSGR
jgi:hypothetical protein